MKTDMIAERQSGTKWPLIYLGVLFYTVLLIAALLLFTTWFTP